MDAHNSLILSNMSDFDINESNLCYTFEYWTKVKSTINIQYRAIGDDVTDNLLSIKPQSNTDSDSAETIRMCLRDFVALNSRNFMLMVSVDANQFSRDKFGLIYTERIENSPWNLSPKPYLHKWMIPYDLKSSFYANEWVSRIPEVYFPMLEGSTTQKVLITGIIDKYFNETFNIRLCFELFSDR